jgi:hypothetical protein
MLVRLDADEAPLRAGARANAEAVFAPATVVETLVDQISRCTDRELTARAGGAVAEEMSAEPV